MQVQKLQNGNARVHEQYKVAEQRLRSAHASELSAQQSDISLLQERCESAVRQYEAYKTESAAKVCCHAIAVPDTAGTDRLSATKGQEVLR